MHKLILHILLIFILNYKAVIAQVKPHKMELQAHMVEMAKALGGLFPLMYEVNNLKSKETRKRIVAEINKLSDHFNAAQENFEQSPVGYQISYKAQTIFFKNLKTAFSSHSDDYALKMIRTIPYICLSCHGQDGQERALDLSLERTLFSSDWEYAEYNAVTRGHYKAIRYFDRFLRNVNNWNDEYRVIQSFYRIIELNSFLLANPEKEKDALRVYLEIKGIPENIRRMLNLWIEGLDVWKKKYSGKLNNYKEIEIALKDHEKYILPSESEGLTPSVEIFLIKIIQILELQLNQGSSKIDAPRYLYWLALCEKAKKENIFSNVDDLYLKECVISYPEHPYAKKCLEEYKNSLKIFFEGLSKAELPANLSTELTELESLVSKSLKK